MAGAFKQLLQDPTLPVGNPTSSYWQKPPHQGLLGIKSATLPSQRDIVIIGSGITACSVTRELLQGGYSGTITILEAREVCSGATGRNGGRINCVAVQDFHKFKQLYGIDVAKQIVRFELAHFDELMEVARSLGDEAFKRTEVRAVETVAAAFTAKKFSEMKEMLGDFETAFPDLVGRWRLVEKEAREVLLRFLFPVDSLSDKRWQKYGIKDAKGALIGSAGAASAYRLVTEIFSRLLSGNKDKLTIETQTPVLQISRVGNEPQSHPYELKTSRGSLRAKHVIHCTEGHVSHLVPGLRGILVPRRGQMSVLNPGHAFKDTKGKMSWSFYFDQGFDYLSQNEHTGELYVGGGDLGGFDAALDIHGIASDAEENIASKSHLAGIMPVVFGKSGWGEERPGKPLLHASWTGIMCNSLDRLPLVGMLPQEALGSRAAGDAESGAEWISAGYGGYGMVNAWLCGKAVARPILGDELLPWLPQVYRVTPDRMNRLKQRLDEIKGTSSHLRALL